MKGMLIKDFKLLATQKRTIGLFGVIGLMLIVTNMDPGFVLAYLTFLCCNLALSTISYDNIDNGNTFLFTLPISRRGYVSEKYLFSIGIGTAAWFVSGALCLLIGLIQKTGMDVSEFVVYAPVYLLLAFLMAAFMIPIQLKFGAERARTILVGMVGGLFLVVVLTGRAIKKLGLDVEKLFHAFGGLGIGTILLVICILVIGLTAVSWRISCRIMEKKEF